MRYILIEYEQGNDGGSPSLWDIFWGVLWLIFPKANPDLAAAHEKVVTWWVEVNDFDGAPEREIGFDAAGEPIALGPVGRNTGIITDSTGHFVDEEDVPWIRERFQATWDALLRSKFPEEAALEQEERARQDPYA